jgi:hypothetical protein
MVEQYDLFGGCSDVKEDFNTSRKMNTMQKIYGYKEDETCKGCKYLLKFDYHNRTYYKCELWVISHSAATDIRLKNKACNKWKPRE